MKRFAIAAALLAGIAVWADNMISITHSSTRSRVTLIELVFNPDGGWTSTVCGVVRYPDAGVAPSPDNGLCDSCEVGPLSGPNVNSCVAAWKTNRSI
jgi:hypothetical protein